MRIDAAGGPSESAVDAAAGVAFTLVFRVANTDHTERILSTHLQAPDDWQVLFASDRLRLAPRSAVVDTVTIVPPRNARAGVYTLAYETRLAPSYAPLALTVPVRIRERRSLALLWLDAPAYVPAGEINTLTLLVTNEGNVAETVTIELRSQLGATSRLSWTKGLLEAGERRRVQVDVRPDSRIGAATHEGLTARATSESMSVAAESGVQFDVVPSGRSEEVPGPEFPTALALRIGTNRDPGFGSFTGRGVLNRRRTVSADFGLLSREDSHPLMMEQDRYFASVRGPAGQLMVGDHTWSMSFLTEDGHYGFGAGGRFEGRRWVAGGFVDDGRRDVEERRQAAAYVGARLGSATRLTLQGLKRSGEGPGGARAGELGTVRMQVRPGEWLSGDFEVGTGRSVDGTGRALSVLVGHASQVMTLYARRVRADSTYPIRDRNALIDGFGFSVRPVGRLQFEGTYDGTEQLFDFGLPLDAPTRQRMSRAGVSWGSLVRLQASRRMWTGPGGDWDTAWRRESIGAEVEVPLWRFRLTPGVERGVEATPYANDTRYSLNWLQAAVNLGGTGSVYARGEYGRGIGGDPDQRVRRMSFGGVVRITEGTRFNLQVHNSAMDAPWLRGTQWATAALDHRLPWSHHIVATYRRRSSGTSLLPSSEAYRADYVIPFGIPLRYASERGRVTVRLHDGDTGQSQPGYLVQVAGHSLLTDSRGVADFDGVAPGQYFITVPSERLGFDRTILPLLPLRVSVAAGRRTEVAVTVVRTGRVAGQLRMYQSVSGGWSGDVLAPGSGVADAVLELNGLGDRRVAVTDGQGRFAVDGLPPGEWRLRIAQVDIPPFYQVEDADRTLLVEPGGHVDLDLRVVPKLMTLDIEDGVVDTPTSTPQNPERGR